MSPTEYKIKVDAQTQVYGILGDPVHHSLSPLLQNALFREARLNAVYLAFEVPKDSLAMAFEGIRSLGIRGVNITLPHKENAMNFVDEIPEDLDRGVGSVNTVVNRNGTLFGYNTDVAGFLIALKEELGADPQEKKAFVLGAGGAARAAVFALAHARASKILIYNRTLERAEGLSGYMESYFPDTEFQAVKSLEEVKNERIELVVNATSCGMTPPSVLSAEGGPIAAQSLKTGGGVKPEDPLPFDLKLLRQKASVYDLVYSPTKTPFLKSAEDLGFPFANGLGMLAAQAALSFGLWTGKKEGVREAMLEILRKCPL